MNKQQYIEIRHHFRERALSVAPPVRHFPVEIQNDVNRLFQLRDRCDMLECRAMMTQSGVYSLRLRLQHCANNNVLERFSRWLMICRATES